jgi:hypothetical protein
MIGVSLRAPAAGDGEQAPSLPLPLVGLSGLAGLVLFVLGAFALFAAVFAITGAPRYGDLACASSGAAKSGIPPAYLRLYHDAGTSFGLDWAVLAAIGFIESGHGLNMGPSSAGALGPMQFMPGTWTGYQVDGDGDGRKDVMDPADAIPAAARLLKANGAPREWRRAIFAYNHADWYVADVLSQAESYRGQCRVMSAPSSGGQLSWPVVGSITSPFCERRAWERCHPGIDIAVPSGTPVLAAASGQVKLAEPVSGYGNLICVAHTRGLTTCYAHLAEYRTRVGARVGRGEVIALSDCTGRCFGAHLHFEVRRGVAGRPVDPLRYLEGRAG